MPRRALLAALLPLCSTGCVARGFFTDGTSVSLGRADRGLLRGGRPLPLAGEGWEVPPTWADRGMHWGTDELVEAIERAAAAVEEQHPGGLLGVGDLSRRGGGNVTLHRSHENGRDADLIFYAVDETGAPVGPFDGAMPRYRAADLRSRPPYEAPPGVAVPARWFDVARNWALVEALLTDPTIDVEYLFISEKLRERLLDYAATTHAHPEVIRRAQLALRQPHGFPPHDDHLHLRIRCPSGDRALGCVDEGRVRLRSEVARDPLAPKPKHRRVG